MFAIVVTQPGGPDVLALQQVPDPGISDDEILVDVEATALNRADILQREGRYPPPVWADQSILGLEMAGLVTQIGPRVHTVTVGQKVFGLLSGGGFLLAITYAALMVVIFWVGVRAVRQAAQRDGSNHPWRVLYEQSLVDDGKGRLGRNHLSAAVQVRD